ncbi:hypothetical protein [Sphingomonas sp. BK235]|uniref:hypothetical protein n=1 Tax=Sphingomonas sp. BK235 TaxID=2512131 RepID=UPI0010455188|nr:hypothetical protein [Sphingomonas sp. BK235]TCP33250.1 hypothetical protein EV292_106192 [Sphingomonas sp. BK235]
MTKVRAPLTIENALFRVLGEIGIEIAAEVTGRGADYLRALSDPDRRERLTIEDAIKLDLHHRATGGVGFPIFETYGRIVESSAAERFADAAAIGAVTIDLAKESGEALAASIAAAQPGADVRTLETALRELEQADEATSTAITTIRQAVSRIRDGPPAQPG